MGQRLEYLVRDADREQDNEALCRLSLRTPMESQVTVAIDRSPEFFSFYDLHGMFNVEFPEELQNDTELARKINSYTCTVAMHEGRLVGTLAIAHRHVLFNGEPLVMAYPMDARVDPDYQHKGVLRSIGMYLPQAYPEVEIDCIMGVILRGNRKAQGASQQTVPQHFIGRPAGWFNLVQFSMYWPYRERKGLKIEQATEDDLDEIAQLLTEFYSDHNFAPRMDRAWLDDMLQRSKGYSVSDISLVRENGRIAALVGLWDQNPIRRMVVLRNTWPIRLGIFAARLLHLLIPSPVPPRTGKPMRSLFIKHIAHRPGHEQTLREMLKVLLNRTRRGRNHHFVWGSFYESSPLLPLFKGFSATRSYSQAVYAPWNSGWDATPEQVSAKPIYIDFSMV
ncbi:MAG: GNAT family N-acetyltransferase [Candidatus Alcyoniella australis]|nr:GNAT family N-acetyltransferase [Candidatus Alcyoniella australis]